MQAAGSSHHVCAPAVRVFRPPADASAAERVDVAMRAVRRARRPRLGAQRYAPPDAMGLQADLRDSVKDRASLEYNTARLTVRGTAQACCVKQGINC